MPASSEAALLSLLQEHHSLGNAKARQLLGLDEGAYESLKRAYGRTVREHYAKCSFIPIL